MAVQYSNFILVLLEADDGARGVAVRGDEGVAVADEGEGALHGARCFLSRFASRRVDGVLVGARRLPPVPAATAIRSGEIWVTELVRACR